jgi:hypothetical protein
MKNITPIIKNTLSFLNSINQLFDKKVKDISLNRKQRRINNVTCHLSLILYYPTNHHNRLHIRCPS